MYRRTIIPEPGYCRHTLMMPLVIRRRLPVQTRSATAANTMMPNRDLFTCEIGTMTRVSEDLLRRTLLKAVQIGMCTRITTP